MFYNAALANKTLFKQVEQDGDCLINALLLQIDVKDFTAQDFRNMMGMYCIQNAAQLLKELELSLSEYNITYKQFVRDIICGAWGDEGTICFILYSHKARINDYSPQKKSRK